MIDKSKYEVEIPENLDAVVQGAIDEGLYKRNHFGVIKKAACAAVTFLVCMVSLLNISSGFAAAAYDIPIIGNLCRIFTFREYHFEDDIKYIDVKIPQFNNDGKSDIEKRVNLEIQKIIGDYVEESEVRAKEYYEAYVQTGGDPKEFIPIGITIDYEIKHLSSRYVSFVITQYETNFSAYTSYVYYNIDLESGRKLTLKDWLGSDYRQIAADSIEHTISGWSSEQKELLWDDLSVIDLISENTDFYIDQNRNAVVVFEKYEAARGSAGTLEFTIQAAEK